uniref:Glycoprotein n=1 Tax=Coleopteran rhabdo-related virus OKIAV28 TaxID=2746288 RepID=A0A7D7JIP1_9RHAB|nr:glycoprotein [Coleopteran rhabdo-related virus OKIAV28]
MKTLLHVTQVSVLLYSFFLLTHAAPAPPDEPCLPLGEEAALLQKDYPDSLAAIIPICDFQSNTESLPNKDPPSPSTTSNSLPSPQRSAAPSSTSSLPPIDIGGFITQSLKLSSDNPSDNSSNLFKNFPSTIHKATKSYLLKSPKVYFFGPSSEWRQFISHPVPECAAPAYSSGRADSSSTMLKVLRHSSAPGDLSLGLLVTAMVSRTECSVGFWGSVKRRTFEMRPTLLSSLPSAQLSNKITELSKTQMTSLNPEYKTTLYFEEDSQFSCNWMLTQKKTTQFLSVSAVMLEWSPRRSLISPSVMENCSAWSSSCHLNPHTVIILPPYNSDDFSSCSFTIASVIPGVIEYLKAGPKLPGSFTSLKGDFHIKFDLPGSELSGHYCYFEQSVVYLTVEGFYVTMDANQNVTRLLKADLANPSTPFHNLVKRSTPILERSDEEKTSTISFYDYPSSQRTQWLYERQIWTVAELSSYMRRIENLSVSELLRAAHERCVLKRSLMKFALSTTPVMVELFLEHYLDTSGIMVRWSEGIAWFKTGILIEKISLGQTLEWCNGSMLAKGSFMGDSGLHPILILPTSGHAIAAHPSSLSFCDRSTPDEFYIPLLMEGSLNVLSGEVHALTQVAGALTALSKDLDLHYPVLPPATGKLLDLLERSTAFGPGWIFNGTDDTGLVGLINNQLDYGHDFQWTAWERYLPASWVGMSSIIGVLIFIYIARCILDSARGNPGGRTRRVDWA